MVLHNTGVIIAYTVVGVSCYEYNSLIEYTPPSPKPYSNFNATPPASARRQNVKERMQKWEGGGTGALEGAGRAGQARGEEGAGGGAGCREEDL